MAKIVIWPDRVLNNATQAVVDFGPDLKALLERMRATVVEAEGIGLAANQIGVPLRVALVAPQDGETFEMVNPRITGKRVPVTLDEACLSVPGESERVPRFLEVDVTFQDASGKERSLTAKDRLAHIIQHEVDHLDGVVFVRHLGPVKRELIRGRMEKLKKES